MKNFYYAVEIRKSKKQYSYVESHGENNLIGMFERLMQNGAVVVHPCHTKKHAEELTDFWNECAKKNGNYLFDTKGGNMTHFQFRYGNPYISFTEKEKQRILRQYKGKIKKLDKDGKFYFIEN